MSEIRIVSKQISSLAGAALWGTLAVHFYGVMTIINFGLLLHILQELNK